MGKYGDGDKESVKREGQLQEVTNSRRCGRASGKGIRMTPQPVVYWAHADMQMVV